MINTQYTIRNGPCRHHVNESPQACCSGRSGSLRSWCCGGEQLHTSRPVILSQDGGVRL